MKVAYGTTRVVILVGSKAIKFPRIPVFLAIRRAVLHIRSRQVDAVMERNVRAPKVHLLVFLFRYFFSGFRVNYMEYRQWKEAPRLFLVPTHFSLLGIINIQERGRPVSARELRDLHPFPHLLRSESESHRFDMTQAVNFCHYKGRICLLDYGREETRAMLSKRRIGARLHTLEPAQLRF